MAENKIEILEAQIRDCFGRVVWTHKTHEKCADILLDHSKNVKLVQLLLSVITTSGILIGLFGDNNAVSVVAAIVSAILLFLNTYIKEFELGKVAQEHAQAAIKIWNIKELYLSLLTDIKTRKINEEEIRQRRDALQTELFDVYKITPRSISSAYNKASDALKNKEEATITDEEIDLFLPPAVRKFQGKSTTPSGQNT